MDILKEIKIENKIENILYGNLEYMETIMKCLNCKRTLLKIEKRNPERMNKELIQTIKKMNKDEIQNLKRIIEIKIEMISEIINQVREIKEEEI